MSPNWAKLSLDPTPLSSWTAMLIYWSVGVLLAVHNGYTALPFFTPYESDLAYFMTVYASSIMTMIVANTYTTNQTTTGPDIWAGRSLSWFSLFVIPAINSVAETWHFFAWFDAGQSLGKYLIPAYQGAYVSFLWGYLLFFLVSGMSHALFWGGLVFPQPHVPVSPIIILYLSVQGLLWLLLFVRKAIWVVMAQHFILDVMVVLSCRIPPPWAEKRGSKLA